jgi:GNAT superfamily N-acetyltransferase
VSKGVQHDESENVGTGRSDGHVGRLGHVAVDDLHRRPGIGLRANVQSGIHPVLVLVYARAGLVLRPVPHQLLQLLWRLLIGVIREFEERCRRRGYCSGDSLHRSAAIAREPFDDVRKAGRFFAAARVPLRP